MGNSIEKYPLKHKEEIVSFAIRTMEEIYESGSGATGRPHRHDYYTVLWVRKARGVHHIDFRDYDLLPHSLFFVTPGQVHQLEFKEKPKGVVILFTEDFLQQAGISAQFITNLHLFLDCDENPPLKVDKHTVGLFEALCYEMFKELEKSDPFSYDIIGANLKLFLIYSQRISDRKPAQTDNLASPSFHLVRRFKELVEQQYRQWHKVSEYSESLSITANHLNEVIRENLGTSAKEYVQNRIILEAKRMAYFDDSSAKSIGYELGFDDPAHFGKFFKNCVGESFTSFRSHIRDFYY